jgi:hypothetical protein
MAACRALNQGPLPLLDKPLWVYICRNQNFRRIFQGANDEKAAW